MATARIDGEPEKVPSTTHSSVWEWKITSGLLYDTAAAVNLSPTYGLRLQLPEHTIMTEAETREFLSYLQESIVGKLMEMGKLA